MFAFRYDENKMLVRSEPAYIDPLESQKAGHDIYVCPANCTFTEPNQSRLGYGQRWNGDAWEYVECHIGETGYVNGEPFTVSDYGPLPEGWSETPPPPSREELAEQVRRERDAKLADTDYLLLPDYPISQIALENVKTYRQALRDITAQPGFPNDVTWPELQ